MSEEQKILKALLALLKEGRVDAFQLLYEGCSFDIDHYRSWTGLDNRFLLTEAMLQNQPATAGFLAAKIGINDLPGIEAVCMHPQHDAVNHISLLYMAINNNMESLALKLIRHPKTDLEKGKELKTARVDALMGVVYHTWQTEDSLFAAAARRGNRIVIAALYDETISRLETKADRLSKNAILFPGLRAGSLRRKIEEFRQARGSALSPAVKTAAQKLKPGL